MKEIVISKNEAGQRLDKLLARYLKEAPKSFLYKMMRKKNITVNGKKVTGNEITVSGDTVRIFLSDETYAKFAGAQKTERQISTAAKIEPIPQNWILYEDAHILVVNKPAGILSQKSRPEDISVNERIISYLLNSKAVTPEELQTFRPSVCNRLDRNTSGLLIAGKTLAGLQTMAAVLQDRSLHKYYMSIVHGSLTKPQHLEGYLVKNHKDNRVKIYTDETLAKQEDAEAKAIATEYCPIKNGNRVTLLEILLLTGRSHQIRAHLASIGHAVIGDTKYGKREQNAEFRSKYHLENQLLHACRMKFPEISGELSYLSGKVITAPLPPLFEKIMEEN